MAGGTSTEEGLQEGSVSTDAEHVWMHWRSAALRTSPGKRQVSTDADQEGGSARRRPRKPEGRWNCPGITVARKGLELNRGKAGQGSKKGQLPAGPAKELLLG